MDYHELQKTTVVKLREMAQEYPDIVGASGMHKEDLVDLLADKMGIEKPHKIAVGIRKGKIKREIRKLKVARQEALEKKDREELRRARKKIHKLRRKLRNAIKVT